jgi:hypothetical protein
MSNEASDRSFPHTARARFVICITRFAIFVCVARERAAVCGEDYSRATQLMRKRTKAMSHMISKVQILF